MSAHERERLAAWIDGELPPGERASVEAHVAECEECAALLADLEAVDGFARELPLEVPAGYFEGFPARVRSRIEAHGPRRGATRAGWRTPAWTWAAAAALLLGVVTPLTIARLGRDGAPETTLRVGAEAKDALTVAEARRPAAPSAVVPRGDRRESLRGRGRRPQRRPHARPPAPTLQCLLSPRRAEEGDPAGRRRRGRGVGREPALQRGGVCGGPGVGAVRDEQARGRRRRARPGDRDSGRGPPGPRGGRPARGERLRGRHRLRGRGPARRTRPLDPTRPGRDLTARGSGAGGPGGDRRPPCRALGEGP